MTRKTRKRRLQEKRQGMMVHAQQRAQERYGLVLSAALHREMVEMIKTNRSRILSHGYGRRVHELFLDGMALYPVYEPAVQRVVTLLPPDSEKITAWKRQRDNELITRQGIDHYRRALILALQRRMERMGID